MLPVTVAERHDLWHRVGWTWCCSNSVPGTSRPPARFSLLISAECVVYTIVLVRRRKSRPPYASKYELTLEPHCTLLSLKPSNPPFFVEDPVEVRIQRAVHSIGGSRW